MGQRSSEGLRSIFGWVRINFDFFKGAKVSKTFDNVSLK